MRELIDEVKDFLEELCKEKNIKKSLKEKAEELYKRISNDDSNQSVDGKDSDVEEEYDGLDDYDVVDEGHKHDENVSQYPLRIEEHTLK